MREMIVNLNVPQNDKEAPLRFVLNTKIICGYPFSNHPSTKVPWIKNLSAYTASQLIPRG